MNEHTGVHICTHWASSSPPRGVHASLTVFFRPTATTMYCLQGCFVVQCPLWGTNTLASVTLSLGVFFVDQARQELRMSWQREETRILRRWDRRGCDLEPEDLNSSLSSSLC